MPYIVKERRERIDPHLDTFWKNCPIAEPGELNYTISRLLELYRGKHLSYTIVNTIIGVLSCIKEEYYRKIVAPYEDTKENVNGTVWGVEE